PARFPAPPPGLGALARRILSVLANGALEFPAVFPQVDTVPPKFGFGAAQVMATLRVLAARPVPLITMTGSAPKTLFAITPAGENVLSGEIDECKINDPDAWLGGVHLTKENLWRWNGATLSLSPA